MNLFRNRRRLFQSALAFVFSIWLGAAHSVASTAEETFPIFQTRTATYTNVTVTTKSKNYVFILHSAGMANIAIEDLTPELKETLGYATKTEKHTFAGSILPKNLMPKISGQFKPLEDLWRERVQPKLNHRISKNTLDIIFAISLVSYLFFCFCCQLICRKAGKPAGFLIWIPVAQWIPLLRAAGMSGWWFLAMFVPLLNVIAIILFSLKIAKARGKSALVGVLLLLPVTNFIAFLYLAFSGEPKKEEGKKYRSMSLQTA
ncbi:MAG TPA: DUF5684 domain-containing protein [Verrucomicrobiae bacterium]|nr:DUF5684 domain-containing protein [Verrucomicrobiae bacterium]